MCKTVNDLTEQKLRAISSVDGRVGEERRDVSLDIRKWKLNKRRKEIEEEIKVMRSKENLFMKKEFEARVQIAQQNLRQVEEALRDDSFDQKFDLIQSRSAILYPIPAGPPEAGSSSNTLNNDEMSKPNNRSQSRADGYDRIKEL